MPPTTCKLLLYAILLSLIASTHGDNEQKVSRLKTLLAGVLGPEHMNDSAYVMNARRSFPGFLHSLFGRPSRRELRDHASAAAFIVEGQVEETLHRHHSLVI